MIKNSRYEIELIRNLHSAALTIQNYWRDYILKRKTPIETEEKNDILGYIKKDNINEGGHPNNNRSTSRNAWGIPKLDLTHIASDKEKDLNNAKDGMNNE